LPGFYNRIFAGRNDHSRDQAGDDACRPNILPLI
jgi:hypothetical protein